MLTKAHGIPLAVVIDGANRHDMKLVKPTLEALKLDRPMQSMTAPQGLCMDKGYDYDEVRDLVAEFGFTAHIRSRRGSAATQTRGERASQALGR